MCIALIVLSAINLFASFIYPTAPWNLYLAFIPQLVNTQPWTFLTYPLAVDIAGGGLLSVVFTGWWLYSIGSSVERDLGAIRFTLFWIAMTVVPALALWAGMMAFHVAIPLVFMFLPLSAVTVAWATRNPNSTVNLMLVIPIQAKWLGFLTAGLVLFGYGVPHPQLGVIACIHLVLAFLYASNRIPFLQYGSEVFTRRRTGWKPVERNDSYFADVKKREIERAERERLRKMFEGSLSDDPEDKR